MNIIVSSNGWGVGKVQDIKKVLDSVHMQFAVCFGEENMNHNNVIVAHNSIDTTPRCYRNQHIIILSAKDRLWSQYAYQFAHEYCHYQIQGDVSPTLRWFEESICELSSYFFMICMSQAWEIHPPYENWREYAPCLLDYARNAANENPTKFDLDFSNPENPNPSYLETHEYDRGKNAYVAVKLLPIFLKAPRLWHAVTILSQIPHDLDFRTSLQHWNAISPEECKESIAEVARIFSLQL